MSWFVLACDTIGSQTVVAAAWCPVPCGGGFLAAHACPPALVLVHLSRVSPARQAAAHQSGLQGSRISL